MIRDLRRLPGIGWAWTVEPVAAFVQRGVWNLLAHGDAWDRSWVRSL